MQILNLSTFETSKLRSHCRLGYLLNTCKRHLNIYDLHKGRYWYRFFMQLGYSVIHPLLLVYWPDLFILWRHRSWYLPVLSNQCYVTYLIRYADNLSTWLPLSNIDDRCLYSDDCSAAYWIGTTVNSVYAVLWFIFYRFEQILWKKIQQFWLVVLNKHYICASIFYLVYIFNLETRLLILLTSFVFMYHTVLNIIWPPIGLQTND